MGVINAASVSAEAREGRLPGRAPVQVAPQVRPYIAFTPLPNATIFADGRGQYVRAHSDATGEDFFVIRMDHQFSSKDSLTARYTLDDSSKVTFDSLSYDTNFAGRNQYVVLEEKRIFTQDLLNTFRFGFNRSFQDVFQSPLVEIPRSLFFRPEASVLGALSVTSLSGMGTGSTLPRTFAYNVFEWVDNLNLLSGRHSVKMGADIKRMQLNVNNFFNDFGSYSFSSVVQGSANSYRGVLPGFERRRGIRQSLLGFYLQDDFKWKPTVTWNLGLRYEFHHGPDRSQREGGQPPEFFRSGHYGGRAVLQESIVTEPCAPDRSGVGSLWER
ncbi:MAG: TonB-dependent receptor [Acidobacteria bacterium]|nr:TonB-dependent receptor [Acidobacteriota bacterium]